jgi:CRP-like cAMP-binding protein
MNGGTGRVYEDGECVVRSGEECQGIYLVQQGTLEVVYYHRTKELRLAVLKPGDIFDEMALPAPRRCLFTVRAMGRAQVLVVDNRTLLGWIEDDPEVALGLVRHLSQRIHDLRQVQGEPLLGGADALGDPDPLLPGALGKVYRDGQYVIREGELAASMYVVQRGALEVLQLREGREERLGVLGPGDIFGEMALFKRGRCSATARALGEAQVLTLDRGTLLEHIAEDPLVALHLIEVLGRRVQELGQRGALPSGDEPIPESAPA